MPRNPIRHLEEKDIPAVADLQRRVYNLAPELTKEFLASYQGYVRSVLGENPRAEPRLAPLVFEESDGRIAAFLGVSPRAMKFQGRPVTAVVTSQLVADPDSRSLAGVRLMKACLEGPQDLTLADEANDLTRQLWERLGGRTAFGHSVRWLLALRPAQLGLTVTPRLKSVATPLRPVARLADAVLSRLPQSPFGRRGPATLAGDSLDSRQLLELLQSVRAALVSAYTEQSLDWVLERVKSLRELHGPLRSVRVVAPDGTTAGCYLYHRKTEGVSRVVFFWSQPGREDDVLSHLLEDAWLSGCLSIGGRVPLRFQRAFARARCMMDFQQKWFLVYSRTPEIEQAICAGDDNLCALDGEWPTHFNYRSSNG